MQVPQRIQHQFQQMLADGSALELQRRLAQKDVTLWSDDPDVKQMIDDRLGWIDCIELMLNQVDSILTVRQNIFANGLTHCVLLGMGGSSLAPELFSKIFTGKTELDGIRLTVADNTSPDFIFELSDSLNFEQTLFIVASKSGTTIESDSLFRYFYEQLNNAGVADPGRHFVAITDADTTLEQSARQMGFLHCFINPADIGGRFSVLSYFGLVPASLLGIDISQLLKSAKKELIPCQSTESVSEATKLGIILGLAAENGLDKVKVKLADELEPFAAWLEQLVAESTGKSGKGILPLVETFDKDAEQSAHSFAITLIDQAANEEQAVLVYKFDCDQMGAEFFRWEWATALAGSLMVINPFDEPNVGENKKITVQQLELPDSSSNSDVEMPSSKSVIFSASCTGFLIDRIKILVESIQTTDYLAILIYGINKIEIEPLLENFRGALKNRFGILSTVGIGPRYLHSTGQLHKGGANNGAFLIITADFSHDLAIPGKPYTFAQLNHAQASGDIKALQTKGRRLLHIHLDTVSEGNLQLLAATLWQSID